MIVAIAKSTGSGIQAIEEFREAVDSAAAVADFAASNTPTLDPGDYLGVATVWLPGDSNLRSPWAYDYDTSTLVENLALEQDELIARIEEHRDERFRDVVLFEYPAASGNKFSCSIESQHNWGNLSGAEGLRGSVEGVRNIDFPFSVRTYDKRSSYAIRDREDLAGIVKADMDVVMAERTDADTAMAAVFAATTVAASKVAAAVYLDK